MSVPLPFLSSPRLMVAVSVSRCVCYTWTFKWSGIALFPCNDPILLMSPHPRGAGPSVQLDIRRAHTFFRGGVEAQEAGTTGRHGGEGFGCEIWGLT